jgi:hypothetical protein
MKPRPHFLALVAVLAMTALALPALADSGHSTMALTCADPSPNGAGQHGTASCSFTLNPGGDFGNTDNDKTDWIKITLPVDAKLNEDENSDPNRNDEGDGHADPSDGEKIGETKVTQLDLSYDGCGDANDGGNTYSTYWEDTWRAYTPPAGWTKVAEYNTVFTVLFVFTENVPSHVIKNDTTGQYAVDTDLPQARSCAGSVTTFNPLVTYGYAQNNSRQEWVGTNPSTAGNYTVKLEAKEFGGTVHDDTDEITIS